MDDCKSTTGFVFYMGDTAFKYVAATSCVFHAILL